MIPFFRLAQNIGLYRVAWKSLYADYISRTSLPPFPSAIPRRGMQQHRLTDAGVSRRLDGMADKSCDGVEEQQAL